jgi:hypothetical protein
MDRLRTCVGELNKHELAFTIQLGDIIDGNETPEKTLTDLDNVVQLYETLTMPRYHVIGNHCLDAGQESLRQKLNLEGFYYDFIVPEAHGWRFIVLNGNEGGYGLLGEPQLLWLGNKLKTAEERGEKVIVFNHFALLEAAARNHRMADPQPVLRMITKSNCVVAYFAGHDHAGGYTLQDDIHHITVKGMVEASEQNAYAIVRISPGKLNETGFGLEPSRELDIDDNP